MTRQVRSTFKISGPAAKSIHRNWRVSFRGRLRDKHFWFVAGLVLVIAGLHSIAELGGMLSDLGKFYFFTQALFLVPLIYASLRFGFMGSLITALVVIVVNAPDWIYWHEGLESLGVILMLFTINGVALFLGYRVDRQNEARSQAEMATARLKAYTASVVDTLEKERQRIARELHDDTIQALVLLHRKLECPETGDGSVPSPVIYQISGARDMTGEIIKKLREFATLLRPPILEDLGLGTSIRRLLTDLSQRTRIGIDLKVTGAEPKLSPDVTLGVFRIAQEAMINIERHAKASQVQVILEYSADEIALDIKDNGIGLGAFPPSSWDTNSPQLGLIGMKERTDLLGGTIEFISRPDDGCRISLKIPFSTAAMKRLKNKPQNKSI